MILLILLITSLLFMLVLPYYVERPIKCVPYCTYSLMAINVVIFLAMTIHANVVLGEQKSTYSGQDSVIEQVIRDTGSTSSETMRESSDSNSSRPTNALPGEVTRSIDEATTDEQKALIDKAESSRAAQRIKELEAKITAGKASQDEVLQYSSIRWRMTHADDAFTFDPHPTALKWLAYWVGAPSLCGFFLSMFVHSGLAHIAGNMLFLWLFGRPLEDALGPLIYTLAYIVCGIAAVLLYHITTTAIMPHAAMQPFMGASGAIAGVQGLFAPRFYRTPVRVFYTTGSGTIVMLIAGGALGTLLGNFMGDDGHFIGGLLAIAGIVLVGEEHLWKEFSAKAAWVLGGFFAWNDLRPVMIEIYLGRNIDGVAHWAHIGGFLCGVAYAFMIGLTDEGKAEFLVQDARESLNKNHGTNALEHAQNLLKHKPGDPIALRLMAEAYDTKGQTFASDALGYWDSALQAFLARGDRDGAASAYHAAITRHNTFTVSASTLFALGSHMARNGDCVGAAQTLSKIPFDFPEAPESEMALLRSAQIYAQQLQNFDKAHLLLTTLLQRYPNTEWRPQIEIALQTAQQKIDEERTSLTRNASNTATPVEVPRAQKPLSAAKKLK